MLALKETEFVEAAQAIGVPDRKIVTRHLLPNGMGPIIVAITLGIPAAILAEATLAYIGIGVQPPRASWGSLIAEGQKFIRSEPHLVTFPAIAIAARARRVHVPRRRPARRARSEAEGQAVGGGADDTDGRAGRPQHHRGIARRRSAYPDADGATRRIGPKSREASEGHAASRPTSSRRTASSRPSTTSSSSSATARRSGWSVSPAAARASRRCRSPGWSRTRRAGSSPARSSSTASTS